MNLLHSDTEELLSAIRPEDGREDPLVRGIEDALRRGSGWIGEDEVTSERGQLRYALYLLEQATVMSHRRLRSAAQAVASDKSDWSFLPEDVTEGEEEFFTNAAFKAASEDFEKIAVAIAAIRTDFGFDPDSGGPTPKPGPQPPLDSGPRPPRRDVDGLERALAEVLSPGLEGIVTQSDIAPAASDEESEQGLSLGPKM